MFSDRGEWLTSSNCSTSDEDEWARRLREAISGFMDDCLIGHRQGWRAARLPISLHALRKNVAGQRKMYRARARASKYRKCTPNQLRELFRVSDHGAEGGEAC